MQVIPVAISPDSMLSHAFKHVDYADAWQVRIQSKKGIQVDNMMQAFQPPIWTVWLLRLRDSMVGAFGLKKVKTGDRELSITSLKVGDNLGFFKVFGHTEQELLLGEDDAHLNFRVSFSLEQTNSPRVSNPGRVNNGQPDDTERNSLLTCATIVHYNNNWGKLYFFFVKPFHRLIVRAMLRRMAKSVEG